MAWLIKAFSVIMLASVKLLFAPLSAFGLGFTYLESSVLTAIGALIGVSVFFWLSEYIASKFLSKKPKKIFSKTKRRIVLAKQKIGLRGLAFIGPPFLSVPITCAVMAKFYKHQAGTAYMWLCVSVSVWPFVLSALFLFF